MYKIFIISSCTHVLKYSTVHRMTFLSDSQLQFGKYHPYKRQAEANKNLFRWQLIFYRAVPWYGDRICKKWRTSMPYALSCQTRFCQTVTKLKGSNTYVTITYSASDVMSRHNDTESIIFRIAVIHLNTFIIQKS